MIPHKIKDDSERKKWISALDLTCDHLIGSYYYRDYSSEEAKPLVAKPQIGYSPWYDVDYNYCYSSFLYNNLPWWDFKTYKGELKVMANPKRPEDKSYLYFSKFCANCGKSLEDILLKETLERLESIT